MAANALASSSEASAPEPGTTGTSLSCATRRALALSPIARMFSGRGPIKVMPCSSHFCANSAFSLRKPYPGWIASAPVTSAAERRLRTLRYDPAEAGGPMQIDSSARSTGSEFSSAVE